METTKTGAELSAILATIKAYDPNDPNSNGIPADLWGCLPDQASGSAWVGFIVQVAEEVADILSDEDSYTFDNLVDNVMEYADNNCPPYYADQFEMIKELSLWAIGEVEQRVEESIFTDSPLNIRKQMPMYCVAAYEITYLAVCNYIMSEGAGE